MTMTNRELADAIDRAALVCAMHGAFSPSGPSTTKHLAELQAEQARRAKAPVIDERVLMPRALTAENGAKAALIGDFYVEVEVPNPTPDVFEGSGDTGTYLNRYPVSWTTIKAIYAAAVKHFHPELP